MVEERPERVHAEGQEDLAAWKSMVTINVHDAVRSGEDLAQLANRVLTTYQASGKVLRTNSVPRTKDQEAEHFVVVVLGRPAFIEVAFARLRLFAKTGAVVVYSQ